MKKLILVPLFFFLIAILSNLSAGSTKGVISSAFHAEVCINVPEAGKGTISCVIDGQQKTFTVDQPFSEIKLDPKSKGTKNGFEIQDGSFRKEGFQFKFKKSGVTQIKSDSSGDKNCFIKYYNPKGITYIGLDITVTVTSYNQKKLTGTFSGRMANAHLEKGSDRYPASILLYNGKFDLAGKVNAPKK
jgi:hypothetical protein